MDIPAERRHLHAALLAQGYARVAVEKLTPAGDIDLTAPGVPAQLEQTLRATAQTTNWTELAQRFALLPQMAGGHFDNLYLKAQDKILRLVVVTRFGTAPLQADWLEPVLGYVWPIIENTDDLLEKFTLPDAVQEAGQKLVTAYLGSSDPATQAAASLLNAALAARIVDAGPQAALCVICEAGFTPEIASSVDNFKFFKKKAKLSMRPPYIATFLWNVQNGEVRGKDQTGGGTLSPTQLRGSLQGQ